MTESIHRGIPSGAHCTDNDCWCWDPAQNPLHDAHKPRTVSSNLRVKLLKDIYDDGQDHHPPAYVGRKGDVVVIHSVQTAVVSHNGTGDGFVVHDGELDLSSPTSAVETTDCQHDPAKPGCTLLPNGLSAIKCAACHRTWDIDGLQQSALKASAQCIHPGCTKPVPSGEVLCDAHERAFEENGRPPHAP